MKLKLVALVALIAAVGCGTPDPKESQAGSPGGFETEIKTVVQLKAQPKAGDETTLLTSVDAEITKVLETKKDEILDAALASYEVERKENNPEGTKITRENVEVLLEDVAVAAEETAATRREFSGKVTRFRFTLRRAKARILPDPTRVEALVFCVERSWAPGDTIHFPQTFRAEVMRRLNKAIFDVAKTQNLDPVPPRAPRTE